MNRMNILERMVNRIHEKFIFFILNKTQNKTTTTKVGGNLKVF